MEENETKIMKERTREWLEQQRRKAFLVMEIFLRRPIPEAKAVRRLHYICVALNSGLGGYTDVFREQHDSGYGIPDEYRLRVDLTDPGNRKWLTNIAAGLDNALRNRDRDAISGYNRLLDDHCNVSPRRGRIHAA